MRVKNCRSFTQFCRVKFVCRWCLPSVSTLYLWGPTVRNSPAVCSRNDVTEDSTLAKSDDGACWLFHANCKDTWSRLTCLVWFWIQGHYGCPGNDVDMTSVKIHTHAIGSRQGIIRWQCQWTKQLQIPHFQLDQRKRSADLTSKTYQLSSSHEGRKSPMTNFTKPVQVRLGLLSHNVQECQCRAMFTVTSFRASRPAQRRWMVPLRRCACTVIKSPFFSMTTSVTSSRTHPPFCKSVHNMYQYIW